MEFKALLLRAARDAGVQIKCLAFSTMLDTKVSMKLGVDAIKARKEIDPKNSSWIAARYH